MVKRLTMSSHPLDGAAMDAHPHGDYVLYSDFAELEAEVERLRLELHKRLAVDIDAALSRTGAVKVKALEWEERKTRLGTVWWSAPNPLGGLSIEAASENDKIAAQADYEHRVISALEPATPEGRQDNEPRAYIVHAPEDDYYGTGPDRLQFHPLAQHDLDNGYRQTPLYERPAEQAVTDEMVDAACEAFGLHERKHGLDHRQAGMRAALKAAMEEGR